MATRAERRGRPGIRVIEIGDPLQEILPCAGEMGPVRFLLAACPSNSVHTESIGLCDDSSLSSAQKRGAGHVDGCGYQCDWQWQGARSEGILEPMPEKMDGGEHKR